MQIRVYSGSNTSHRCKYPNIFIMEKSKGWKTDSRHKSLIETALILLIIVKKTRKNVCQGVLIDGLVLIFLEDEKDLYSVMVVLDKCQTVVNYNTGELIQIEEKHELD